MTRSLLWVAGTSLGLLVLTGCPQVEMVHMVVDRKAKTLQLVYEGLGTDKPEEAEEDLQAVSKYLLSNPEPGKDEDIGYEIVSSKMYETDGRLDARVDATFETLGDIGIYQHDRKSALIFCVERGTNQLVDATNGKNLKGVLPGCVAWERKSKVLEVSVAYERDENTVSLLPTYKQQRN